MSFKETKQAIEKNIPKGKDITYAFIEEYDSLSNPKTKREYALKATATNYTLSEQIVKMQKDLTAKDAQIKSMQIHLEPLREELKTKTSEYYQLTNELKAIKAKWWFKLFGR